MAHTHRTLAITKLFERAFARMPSTPAPTAQVTLAQAGRIKSIAEAMESIALNRNPTETDAAHAVRVSKAAATLKTEVSNAFTRVNQNLSDGMRNIQAKIDEATGLKSQSPSATEIRSVFRGLKAADRTELISKAIKDRDTEILAAVLGAHPLLSGLDAKYQTDMRRSYEEQVAPELVAEGDALIDIDAEVAALLRTAEMAAAEAVAPDYIARVAEAAQKAEAAQSEFTAATAPIAAE